MFRPEAQDLIKWCNRVSLKYDEDTAQETIAQMLALGTFDFDPENWQKLGWFMAHRVYERITQRYNNHVTTFSALSDPQEKNGNWCYDSLTDTFNLPEQALICSEILKEPSALRLLAQELEGDGIKSRQRLFQIRADLRVTLGLEKPKNNPRIGRKASRLKETEQGKAIRSKAAKRRSYNTV